MYRPSVPEIFDALNDIIIYRWLQDTADRKRHCDLTANYKLRDLQDRPDIYYTFQMFYDNMTFANNNQN